MSADLLSFQTHVKAVSRDYILKPRPGLFCFSLLMWLFVTVFAVYRTVQGVNGPLVILDNVKARGTVFICGFFFNSSFRCPSLQKL